MESLYATKLQGKHPPLPPPSAACFASSHSLSLLPQRQNCRAHMLMSRSWARAAGLTAPRL